MDCPLCQSPAPEAVDQTGRIFKCPNCDLAFKTVPTSWSREEEKRHYDNHENDPDDLNYRKFLSRCVDPLIPHLSANWTGLDYGSGPGPTISVMLQEKGFRMENWDPFYNPDDQVLNKQYDFITCTEVVEHFHEPRKSWTHLFSLLKQGGVLAVMTKFFDSRTDLSTWHYCHEPTHFSFYSKKTMNFLADKESMEVTFPVKNVAIFKQISSLSA